LLLAGVVVLNNPKAVEDYYSGKKQALNYLVGQVMKATRGRADPGETAKIMKQILDSSDH